MRSIPSSLAEHLAAGTTTLCHCWRLQRRDGLVQGFTDHDRDITFEGVTYEAASGLAATETDAALGMAVTGGEVSGALSSARLGEADVLAGRYDGAEVSAYTVNWADPDQRLLMDVSTIGEIRRSDQAFVAELRGPLHHYDQERGRLYVANCMADLGDTRCGLTLSGADYSAEGVVLSVRDPISLICSHSSSFAAGWFTQGVMTFLTGANAGTQISIKEDVGDGHFLLWTPPLHPVAVGDTLRVTAGCDKHFATCKNKFSNAVNFRGFPHIPTPDYILSYAQSGEGGHDGSLLEL